ncbi:hypothetical protein O181_044822 [Austropuccinia psidii MF-1]|uniref:Uncharacterized protein n=1 Tax=Austropuccinia psidii MF-1 TaxID=1389203 RepID=A0A9Q3HI53_9BASI|nr:hypothetical protein [Austropuccinia psidii MF-1]
MDQFEAFCQREEAHIQEENARNHPQIGKTSVPPEHNKGRVHFDESLKPGPSSSSSLKGKSSIMEHPSIQISTGAEPKDPEPQVSNYQDGIVAASSVVSTSRVKIPAKNDNMGPKTIADYSRHKGGTNPSKNHKGKLKSASQELATDNYLHESLFSDSDGNEDQYARDARARYNKGLGKKIVHQQRENHKNNI